MTSILRMRREEMRYAGEKQTIGRRMKSAVSTLAKKRSDTLVITDRKNATKYAQPPTRKRRACEEISNRKNVDTQVKKVKVEKSTEHQVKVKDAADARRAKAAETIAKHGVRKTESKKRDLDLTELNEAIDVLLCRPPTDVPDIDDQPHDSLSSTVYVNDIVNHLKEKERSYVADEHFLDDHGHVTANMRAILFDWLIQVQAHLGLDQGTLHLATAMVDRFLQRTKIKLANLQLVGITCLFIACKFCERFTPPVDTLIHLTDNTYTYQQVINMEQVVLRILEFKLCIPEPVYFIQRFIRAVAAKPHEQLEGLTRYLLDLSLADMAFVGFSASVRCAAAVMLSHKLLDNSFLESTPGNDAWNLAFYSGHVEPVLRPCMKRYARCLQKADSSKYQGAKSKYADDKKFHGVSKLRFLKDSSVLAELLSLDD